MNLWNDHLGDQIQIYILVKEKKRKPKCSKSFDTSKDILEDINKTE